MNPHRKKNISEPTPRNNICVDLFCTLKTRLLFECWFVLYAQNTTAVWMLICSVRSKHDCCLSVDLFCTLKTRLLFECWFVLYAQNTTAVWVLICSVRSKHDCCLSVDLFCTLKTRLLFECWFVLYAQNTTAVRVLICFSEGNSDAREQQWSSRHSYPANGHRSDLAPESEYPHCLPCRTHSFFLSLMSSCLVSLLNFFKVLFSCH